MADDDSRSAVDLPEETALIVIDVQKGLDEPYWGVRNNPDAEQNMASLLNAWRHRGWAVYHIHHQSKNPKSPLRPGYPGNDIKDIVKPLPGEPVLKKRENSAFVGTDLEERLRAANHQSVVLVGLTTDHCVSTTARMAANLGFKTIVVSDATATFDRRSPITSRHFTADEMHETELTSLSEEFATIAETDTLLHALGASSEADRESMSASRQA